MVRCLLHFHRILGDELVNGDFLHLPHAVDTIASLGLKLRVPVKIQQEQVVGSDLEIFNINIIT